MQEHIWEKEYKTPQLVTLSVEAIASIKDFTRWLRKDQKVELSGKHILDLGCGNGKNSIYIAKQALGTKIVGMEISATALEHAEKLALEQKIDAQFMKKSIGVAFPFPDSSFDIALDVTSSNSLNEKEREVYLKETHRILKQGGYFFVRALCKDGDTNAKTLLKNNPGKEKDTYIMPEFGLTERVFSKEDFIATYSPFFQILFTKKETHYSKFKGKLYKRNFWVVYLQKK